jgi:arylsulfatase A-like enzyme
MVSQVDLMGSFARFFNIDLPADVAVDSRDTWDALIGKDKAGLPNMVEEAGRNQRALRRGSWKYLAGAGPKARRGPKEPELYDLENDPGEQNNVIADHPELAESMARELADIIAGKGMR